LAEEYVAMASQRGVIGLKPEEVECVKTLVRLLRHPDPVVVELSRQALAYLEGIGAQAGSARTRQNFSGERYPRFGTV